MDTKKPQTSRPENSPNRARRSWRSWKTSATGISPPMTSIACLVDAREDIGLATVYRVLNQFESAGLVEKHNFESRARRTTSLIQASITTTWSASKPAKSSSSSAKNRDRPEKNRRRPRLRHRRPQPGHLRPPQTQAQALMILIAFLRARGAYEHQLIASIGNKTLLKNLRNSEPGIVLAWKISS